MITDCIFCKIIARQLPSTIIDETDDILVIQDIHPKAAIHYLIMPKKHIKDIQSFEKGDCCYGSKMMRMAQHLSQKDSRAHDFKFLINNGYNAGQRVFHVHAHFLAGSLLPEF
ncbi:MAG: HIT domain-containing protein [Candidatus Babeliaceae bacterium]